MFDDGTGERLIADGYMVESPTWSPNGRRIIYYEQTPTKDGEDKLTLEKYNLLDLYYSIVNNCSNMLLLVFNKYYVGVDFENE